MCSAILLFFGVFPFQTHWNDGLNVNECMEAVSLCNTFSFEQEYYAPQTFVPLGYRLVYESNTTPLLNKARIFKKGKSLTISFRGTIDATNSWLENIHFMQIAAQDSLIINGDVVGYRFSKRPKAQVHSGYVLGIAYLWKSLYPELLALKNKSEIRKIIFTGHSQGGALAQLFMAQLDLDPAFAEVEFISYSFGSPNIGNKAFATDFDKRFTEKSHAYRFVNTDDVVCKLPVVNQEFNINAKGVNASFDLENLNNWMQIGKELLPKKYKSKVDELLDSGTFLAKEMMREKVGDIVFPPFSTDLIYDETGKVVLLNPEPLPSWFAAYLNEGSSTNRVIGFFQKGQRMLKVEETVFQHFIFNYYNAIYRYYEPKGFRRVLLKEIPRKMM